MLKKLTNNLLNNLPEGDARTGLVLTLCAIGSMLAANSGWGENYLQLWETRIAGASLLNWINDGLMTVFFFRVGLEIKEELLEGALSSMKKALMPALAALGGMLFPAVIYFALNAGTPDAVGWGIPTATDIAFSIGILAFASKRIPKSLVVFLTALAIIDDLGAVVVIALFYGGAVSWTYLGGVVLVLLLIWALQRSRWNFYHTAFSVVAGIVMWWLMHHSGIHATISGVLLALVIPLHHKKKDILKPIADTLKKPVNSFILPLFALANTAIVLNSGLGPVLGSSIGWGIILGLVVGKPLGIMLISWLSVRMNWAHLPEEVNFKTLLGAGMLAGIGFTMSLFVSFLAFPDVERQDISKVAILIGSLIAAIAGLAYLKAISTDKERSNKKT
ncbi:MAG: Na+/H+ antiporter NhaA [Saprospiraceae bacterium]|nr:Na+/H+ antiporter NhaA [Saprospiraceae bacterium]